MSVRITTTDEDGRVGASGSFNLRPISKEKNHATAERNPDRASESGTHCTEVILRAAQCGFCPPKAGGGKKGVQ